MVLLPEEREMTLAELRQIAARQQHQIEAQQQLLAAKKQRLKFLKQQEAHNQNLTETHLDSSCLSTLRDKVETQELKLRQLRALRGQVEQQKTNNSSLGSELDSIRALFSEKEKELDLAVSKVEELSRQLDEIRKNSKKNYVISTSPDLENLQRKLSCYTELSEQQNNYIMQQREKIIDKQQDIATLDQKINELNKRLHRKRLLNEQFASQIHLTSLSLNSNNTDLCNCSSLNDNLLLKADTRVQEILENEQTRDDLAAGLHGFNKYGFGEFSLTKKDPKYQTLPYNTKFTLKEKQLEDLSSSSTEDESHASKTDTSKEMKVLKTSANMCNFSPRPFNNAFNVNSGVQKVNLQIGSIHNSSHFQDSEPMTNKNSNSEDVGKAKEVDIPSSNVPSSQELAPSKPNKPVANPPVQPKSVKPAVPPKPALSVKPMLATADRGRPQPKKKDSLEQDTVNMALTFLKNKSSEREKNDFRYSKESCGAKESSQDPLLPKSRILTYFSKTLLQPEIGSRHQTETNDLGENAKRRLPFEPIKPKPLTIRKNPSIEPPKLKVTSLNSSTSLHQRSSESQSIRPKNLVSGSRDGSLESVPKSVNDADCADNKQQLHATLKVGFQNRKETSISPDSLDENQNGNASNKDAEENGKEVAEGEAESSSSDQSDSSDTCKMDSSVTDGSKKGNLKIESCARTSRRVSFDPLALLLDAALEGELELVKKIATEVVNPSAANDEGITALHNAICAGQFDVVKFLVEFGCDVNSPDSDGWTPLHCAASCNNLAMVKFLVERGACIFATTLSDQETAAEKCEEDGAGFDGCSEYLYSLQENLGIMNEGVVYAVYDYDVQNADELSFKNGDSLTVLRRSDDEENEWWWCRLNDQEGYVPRNLLGLYPRINASCGKPS